MAGLAALPEAVVPLGVEEPLFINPRPLKLVIHIGGQYKILFSCINSESAL